MPSKKKKYNARFPPARIKKIMQSDEEVGKVAQVVPIIISKSLEIFVENLLVASANVTRGRQARTLTPLHIKTTILNRSEYSFLRDLAQSIPDVQMGDLGMEDTNATVDGGGGGPDVPVDFSLRGQQTKPAFGKIVRSSTMTTSGEQTEPAAPRPRGRPRKRPISEDPISFSSSTASLVTPNSFIGATYEGRNKIERTSNSDANLSSMKGPSSSSTTISSSSMDALTNVMGLNASVRTKQVHQTTKASTSSTSISSKLSKNQHEYNINNDSDDTSDDYDNNNENAEDDDSDDDQNSDENQDDYGELDEGEARRAVANLSSIDGGQMQMQRTSVLVANPIPASVSTASSKIVVEDDDYDNF